MREIERSGVLTSLEMPKSNTFKITPSGVSARNKFPGFRSRWTIPKP